MRGAPWANPSPAIDGALAAGLPDGFGVNPAETIDAYIVEVVCWVRAGAACGRGGESKPDQPKVHRGV